MFDEKELLCNNQAMKNPVRPSILQCRNAIRAHRDARGDDRLPYAVLPEKIPCDFRLPPEAEFLGEAIAPHAGRPSFWRSHSACPFS